MLPLLEISRPALSILNAGVVMQPHSATPAMPVRLYAQRVTRNVSNKDKEHA